MSVSETHDAAFEVARMIAHAARQTAKQRGHWQDQNMADAFNQFADMIDQVVSKASELLDEIPGQKGERH
jgi:hypothetical protein